ncbi:MAG: LytTR family transcriptional regulator, partial [Saprospiraceae bacterium]|nr:LytTR family transcriptional regulator [Saprospiraceae bacterium]
DIDDLKKAIQKLKTSNSLEGDIQKLQHFLDEYNKPNKKKLVVQLQSKTLFLEITEIVYLEADSNYTTIYLLDGQKHLTSKTIKYFEEKLSHHNFFRPHQSYLINAEFIKEYDKSDSKIILSNKKSIPVSKNKKDGLLAVLSKL